MAQKDLSEKRLEKLNDVFADMVNGSVFKGKQVVTEKISLRQIRNLSILQAEY